MRCCKAGRAGASEPLGGLGRTRALGLAGGGGGRGCAPGRVVAAGGVGQQQGLELAGVAQRQGLTDQAAHRQAHPDHRLATGHLVDQAGGAIGQIVQAQGASGQGRAAVSPCVRADHPASGGQLVGHQVPHRAVLSQRMAEDHGVARRVAAGVPHGGVQLGAAAREHRAAHARVPGLVCRVGRGLDAQLAHDAQGLGKARVGRRHARVDRDLEQGFAHLGWGQGVGVAGGERAAHVDLELVPAAQGAGHGHHQHAAGFPVQAGTAPDAMPGVVGDEMLEAGVEGIGLGHGLVHPGIAQGGAAVAHAALERMVEGVVDEAVRRL